MPDGVMLWFDESTNEARIARKGRQFPASASDVASSARHPGARVHFDIKRDHGIERAVDVTLCEGRHASPHHHRAGTLVGARRPDTKGPAPFARPHPESGLALAGHPLGVARAWARAVATDDLDHALALYAPDAAVFSPTGVHRGRAAIQAALEETPVRASHREPSVQDAGNDVVVLRWEPPEPGGEGLDTHVRIAHGQIVEQWIGPLGSDTFTTVAEPGTEPTIVNVVRKGEVDDSALEYARERLLPFTAATGEPVLLVRLKLAMAGDPARTRPAMAQVTFDVNGQLVRAHVAAHTLREAIDLLERRLRDKLEHLGEHREALRRHLPQRPRPGEWRHGDAPTARPEYFARPPEEREIVRHKTFAAGELTPDEAAFDMEQLDYDFHLFRDLATNDDAIVERAADGTVAVRHAHDAVHAAPRLTVQQAIERLDASGERYVFFIDAITDRGSVLYVRYDGHYGIITLDGARS